MGTQQPSRRRPSSLAAGFSTAKLSADPQPVFRNQLLMWLLGEDTFRSKHHGRIEQTLIIWLFFIMATSCLFAVGSISLDVGSCREFVQRRLAAEEEIGRLLVQKNALVSHSARYHSAFDGSHVANKRSSQAVVGALVHNAVA